MKKFILTGTILFFFSSLLNAQWIRIYGTSGDDRAYLVLETNDGGCVVAGTSRSIGTSLYSIVVLKLDLNGAIEWEKTCRTNNYIRLHFLRQTGDGGYLIAGAESYYGSERFWSLKLDSWGDMDLDGSLGRWIGCLVQSVAPTNDGGYILGGFYQYYDDEGEEIREIRVAKLNQSNDVEWQKAYKTSLVEELYSIQQTDDGGFALSGKIAPSPYQKYILVLKLFPGGDLEWQLTYGSGGGEEDIAYSMQQTSDRGYILTGYTQQKYTDQSPEDRNALVLKLSSTGDIEWHQTYGGNGDDCAHCIQQTDDGGYIVAGTTYSSGAGDGDFWILKLSSSGNIEWQRTYGTYTNEEVNSIQQTSEGGYLAIGSIKSFGAGSFDSLIMRLLPDGSIGLPCRFIRESTSSVPDVSIYSSQIADLETEETDFVYGVASLYFYLQFSDITEYELCSQHPLLAIISSDGGTTYPPPGTYINDSGVEVEITAEPESGYRFGEWTGDATGTENPLTVIMDSDKSVMASFIRQFSLTILAGEGGTTDPEPGTYVEDSGTEVSINALPESGYQFSEWSGVIESTSNPITITMNLNTSVTANFVPAEEDDKSVLDKIFRIATCAIATAAYDSPSHPYVKILREFRDKYLMRTKPGRSLVKIYYRYSPLAARCIAKHKVLKIIIRFYLLPVVAFSYSMVRFGPLLTAIISLLILAIPIFFVSFSRRKKRQAEARP